MAQLLKKKLQVKGFELDVPKRAIVVNYEKNMIYGTSDGVVTKVESDPGQYSLPIGPFSPNDVSSVADDLISNSPFIHPSTKPRLEHLLRVLLNPSKTAAILVSTPSMKHLDIYLEALYDTVDDKIKATGCLIALARDETNLHSLARNEALIEALARILRENGKESIQLTLNIMRIFVAMSNFPIYSPMLNLHRVGEAAIKITYYELSRTAAWKKRLAGARKALAQGTESQDKYVKLRKQFEAITKKQNPLFFGCFHVLFNLSDNEEGIALLRRRGVVEWLVKMLDRDLLDLQILAVQFLWRLSINDADRHAMIKHDLAEKLLRILPAAQPGVRSKLKGSGSVQKLKLALKPPTDVYEEIDGCPKTQHPALLDPTLRLLFNLSFNSAARNEIARAVPNLVSLLDASSSSPTEMLPREYALELARVRKLPIPILSARLLYHLSLEAASEIDPPDVPDTGTDMEPQPQLPKEFDQVVPYSFVDFPQSSCTAGVMAMRLISTLHTQYEELGAFIVNVAAKEAQIIHIVGTGATFLPTSDIPKDGAAKAPGIPHSPLLHTLIGATRSTHNVLLAKALRNIAAKPDLVVFAGASPVYVVDFFREHFGDLLAFAVSVGEGAFSNVSSIDMLLEMLGVCAALVGGNPALTETVPFALIAKDTRVFQFLGGVLSSFAMENDLLLEAVMLIGGLCTDPDAGALVAATSIPLILLNLLNERVQDDGSVVNDLELSLQILFTLYRLCAFDDIRGLLLQQSSFISTVASFLDPSLPPQLIGVSDSILDMILALDEGFANRVLQHKFKRYNQRWLEAMMMEREKQAIDLDDNAFDGRNLVW
eukprot:gnl/Chilomastix_cuspidata/2254.p1 GENE.gnl/Chilomastix_cuspidata/2254~~gnl/Chilomastix_cuspidata/2254.p1  ORF type:complete len:828 (+),score=445.02 gnl/Chilomastix_cuspidata/2254:35-2518(+)